MHSTTTCHNLFGHEMTVFGNDKIGRKIVRRGLFEEESLTFLLDLLGQMQQPLVLDIGANIGNHTLAFAIAAARVHAFEPIDSIYAVLERNISHNQLDHVSAHRLALSDKDEDSAIHLNKSGNVGASSFDQRNTESEAVIVQRCRGDELLPALGIDRVDLVKIDVESHEIYVVRGLMNTLRTQRPVITMEWNDPLTIERFTGSQELAFLQSEYTILVLGRNYDKGWWRGRPLGWLRRKFIKFCGTRRAVLYDFNPAQIYHNLLLVPKGKEALLAPLLERYEHAFTNKHTGRQFRS